MNKYNVGVHFEEGFSIEVTAPSAEKAEELAKDFIDEYASVSDSFTSLDKTNLNYTSKYLKTYHRDSWIVGVNKWLRLFFI